MVCMGSTCRATFHDAVFDKCSLVVMAGAQVTLHNTHFENMEQSEALLSVYAHGSASQVHLHGGAIEGGVQGLMVQAAARLQASDLNFTGLQLLGLEMCGAESMLTFEMGTTDSFLPVDEVDERFLDEHGDRRAQCGVRVHSHGHAELSGVVIAGKSLELGCIVSSATATLADCTVSGTFHLCVALWGGSTAQIFNCTLLGGREGMCLSVGDAGTHVTATSCHFRGGESGTEAQDGGRLIAHACQSSDNEDGYYNSGGVMELLNCSSDDDITGCIQLAKGHLTATNFTVTDSADGFRVEGGNAELMSCSVTGSRKLGMCFGDVSLFSPGEAAEARVQDCTVAQNFKGGLHALGGALVVVRGFAAAVTTVVWDSGWGATRR